MTPAEVERQADQEFREHVQPGLLAEGYTDQAVYHLRLVYVEDAVEKARQTAGQPTSPSPNLGSNSGA